MAFLAPSKGRLAGKVAIITGGASGIGEATARIFANHGARMIVIADVQDQLGIQVAASIGPQNCTYFHCDVTKEDEIKALVESTVRDHGQLDIMFSNAGILAKSEQTVLDLDLSAFDRLYSVNARGMAACVKHAARAMVEKHVSGSIVCTASVAASRGMKRRTDYCMSKHAVLGLVRLASLPFNMLDLHFLPNQGNSFTRPKFPPLGKPTCKGKNEDKLSVLHFRRDFGQCLIFLTPVMAFIKLFLNFGYPLTVA